jgi:hypothetical protein
MEKYDFSILILIASVICTTKYFMPWIYHKLQSLRFETVRGAVTGFFSGIIVVILPLIFFFINGPRIFTNIDAYRVFTIIFTTPIQPTVQLFFIAFNGAQLTHTRLLLPILLSWGIQFSIGGFFYGFFKYVRRKKSDKKVNARTATITNTGSVNTANQFQK